MSGRSNGQQLWPNKLSYSTPWTALLMVLLTTLPGTISTPEVLACGTGALNDSICLNAGQVNSVRAVYKPIAVTRGRIILSEFGIGAYSSAFSDNQVNGTANLSYKITRDFFRGTVYNDTAWTAFDFNEADIEAALSINPGGVNSNYTDYSRFRARDPHIPRARRQRRHVSEFQGARSSRAHKPQRTLPSMRCMGLLAIFHFRHGALQRWARCLEYWAGGAARSSEARGTMGGLFAAERTAGAG
ncbi:hypothetical protein BJY01DRAFT_250018 [Aspergillus pseudoustus]|uniref:Uncharacterized protein n=1 Tax=Aspergillus pseudoustus TaxID=1810923 RepID=A0ABR4JK24_9EURO